MEGVRCSVELPFHVYFCLGQFAENETNEVKFREIP